MKKWLVILLTSFIAIVCQADPLPANEVFKVSVKITDPNTLNIEWQIKSGYFLYSDRIQIISKRKDKIQIGKIRFPKPLIKIDHTGKRFTVYREKLSIPVAVLGEHPGEA